MSRFAKLVNAKAAREQEPARESEELKTSSLRLKEESTSLSDTTTTGVLTGVATPVRTPVATPVITPVSTGATTPIEDGTVDAQRESPRTSPQYLDATH